MKYIRKFERRYIDKDGQVKQSLSNKTVEYNKIYTFDLEGDYALVGKIIFQNGSLMKGYNIETGEPTDKIIRWGYWRWVRESTPEELERFDVFDKANKYNV